MARRRKKLTSWGPRPEWLQRIVDTEVPPDYQARLMANHERLNREIDQSREAQTKMESMKFFCKCCETYCDYVDGIQPVEYEGGCVICADCDQDGDDEVMLSDDDLNESTDPLAQLTHAELVAALAKPGETIAAEIDGYEAHLIHMVMGISGEAGELLDAIKKYVIYRKPLDRENVIEELGDLEFYMEGLRQGLSIRRETCIDANKAKLAKRYQSLSYSDQAAQERADKAE